MLIALHSIRMYGAPNFYLTILWVPTAICFRVNNKCLILIAMLGMNAVKLNLTFSVYIYLFKRKRQIKPD